MRIKDFSTARQDAAKRMKTGFLAPFVANRYATLHQPPKTAILALQSDMGCRCNLQLIRDAFDAAAELARYGTAVQTYGIPVQ